VFGDTSTPFFIPLNAATGPGYQQIGLLDVFTVGPANEVDGSVGGSQVLELFDFGNAPTGGGADFTSDLGGILRPVVSGGTLIGLEYIPPTNFNSTVGGFDSFTYEVIDDSTTGGETYSLTASGLVPDRLTSTNRVFLNLNPVNDRPEFSVGTTYVEVPEDSTELAFANYAFNISPGPQATAFDEFDFNTGQSVMFTLTPLTFNSADAADFFTVFPRIDASTGELRFQAAPDAFGEFEFEIRLVDNGEGSADGDNVRWDLNTSLPRTLTIDVQPTNDPPVVDPTSDPLQFTLLEDGSFEIPVNGDGTTAGLLDVFLVGPANEAEDILPKPGGNQTLSLGTPVPRASAAGGSVQSITDSTTGEVVRLVYRPRVDFVGMDSFIYTVIDDGSSVGIGTGGVAVSDPRISSNTVSLEVLPVNDAPLFSGAANVVSDEDQGTGANRGLIVVDAWANNVQAGPPTAVDEINGLGATPPQSLEFVFTQVSTTNPGLFESPPVAVISGDSATLTYRTALDANGSATFEVYLQDDGPSDAGIGDQFRGPVTTFSINVRAVNDPPEFTAGLPITINEDHGPYSQPWASAISPGPADESSQSVRFEVNTPPEFQSLFQSQPVINDDGELRFTPALNANTDNTLGPAQIEIIAIDSEDGESDPVTLSITIREINDTPIAVADSIDTDEDTVLTITSAEVLANDIDPDLQSNANEVLTVLMPTESFSISGARVTFDSVSGDITYDPSQSSEIQSLTVNESLADSFSYSVRDASGAISNLVTVGLNIDGINDAPRLTDDAVDLSPTGVTIIRPLDNDTDVDGIIDVTSIVITLQPAFGGITVRADGTLQYTNFVAFSVEDQFQYTVADNLGARSAPAEVIVSANAAPIAVDDAKGTFLDESINIDVAANDSDPDGSLDLNSIVIVTPPTRGQVVPQDGGMVQYLPEPGFVGRDSFTYRIFDNEGRGSNVATVDTRVVASRLQNPDIATDVNQDGFTTALDALLVINHLARADGVASIPVLPTDSGPNFYDVNGNQSITANDAIIVINELSRLSVGSPSGEQVPVLVDPSVDSGTDLGVSAVEQAGPANVADPSKVVDVSSEADAPVSDDLVDLIAADRDSEKDEDQAIAALDAAMADLL
jgi:VCBS repeat-containing protein